MRPAIRAICQTVAEYYGFAEADDILARDRHKSVCEARSVAIWLARRKYGLSFPELGREFGLDHSTCRSSVIRVDKAVGLMRVTADDLAGDLLRVESGYQGLDASRLN